MTQHEYVFIAISKILGLALTRLLNSTAGLETICWPKWYCGHFLQRDQAIWWGRTARYSCTLISGLSAAIATRNQMNGKIGLGSQYRQSAYRLTATHERVCGEFLFFAQLGTQLQTCNTEPACYDAGVMRDLAILEC